MPHTRVCPVIRGVASVEKSDPLVYETYWEVLCHFHICGQLTGWKNGGVKQISWVTYLFPG